MDGLQFVISHTGIWVDLKSIFALAFFVAVVVVFIVRYRMVRKTEKDLEQEMDEAGIAIPGSNSQQV